MKRPRSEAEDNGISLSPEQELVRKEVLSGRSCFLTGCGGTGKSFLTELLIDDLKGKYGNECLAITATTGIAACQIGGVTLHRCRPCPLSIGNSMLFVKFPFGSWAGIGLGMEDAESLCLKIKHERPEAAQRWIKTKCLVVDEISMLSAELFAKLNVIACVLRKNQLPFGGMQLLLVGDFAQLPPVCKNKEKNSVTFCFETPVWRDAISFQYELKKVFRQEDEDFAGLLGRIRMGECPRELAERLEATKSNVFDESNGIKATVLFPKNMEVNAYNTERLYKLEDPLLVYNACDEGDTKYLKDCPALDTLVLKPLAQVILLWNLDVDNGLANGTKGIFIRDRGVDGLDVKLETRFGTSLHTIQKQKFTIEVNGEVVASRTQYPLKLSYALTIHKCQGMTIDKAEMDLRKCFDYGHVYVALSRIKDLKGLRLTGFAASAVKCHPTVKKFYGESVQCDTT